VKKNVNGSREVFEESSGAGHGKVREGGGEEESAVTVLSMAEKKIERGCLRITEYPRRSRPQVQAQSEEKKGGKRGR